jgi:exopolysaccharide/PEP-CTERM locus tyrosine autokinase
MSIIERVAEFLGPAERPSPKSSAEDEKSDSSGLDPIERSVIGVAGHSGAPEAREFATQQGARPRPTRRASRTTQRLSIDLDQLRRQSIITPDGERTPITESFRRIKREILATVANPKAGVPAELVMVTSALAGEGKSFCAINLAISIAQEMDHTVLLVDADVAKPSIPRTLGLNAERGLMDVLRDRTIDLAEVLWKTNIDKLTLLPAGTAHKRATELLASDAMRTLLREMAGRYRDRIVIFDSPPLLGPSEAGALAAQMGQVIVVVEAGKTPEAALKAALALVKSSNVAGLLLNKGEDIGVGYGYGGYG